MYLTLLSGKYYPLGGMTKVYMYVCMYLCVYYVLKSNYMYLCVYYVLIIYMYLNPISLYGAHVFNPLNTLSKPYLNPI
jgi:hypothetical protein